MGFCMILELSFRLAAVAAALIFFGQPAAAAAIHAPLVAHHQHLFSPELVAAGEAPAVIFAKDLVAELDRAGIRRGVVGGP